MWSGSIVFDFKYKSVISDLEANHVESRSGSMDVPAALNLHCHPCDKIQIHCVMRWICFKFVDDNLKSIKKDQLHKTWMCEVEANTDNNKRMIALVNFQ